jgi:hypothetical protein
MAHTRETGSVEDEVKASSEASRKLDALRSSPLAKALTGLALVLVPVITAWTANNRALHETAAVVKDKAEAGYQQNTNFLDQQRRFNDQVVDDLQKLKTQMAELQRRQIRPVKRREAAKVSAMAAVPAPSPPPAVPNAPLAPNLDKALEQVKPAASLPASPAP